jgi:glycosyltransferase involved in cell wall biosynthesis
MAKLVSIILPTYNTGKYIVEMLESISNQTYSPIQLVIVDDNSTDGTYEKIKEWKKEHETISFEIDLIKNNNNFGLTQSVNIGYDKCKGEYIFLSDHDDIWEINKVEKQVELLENSHITSICFHDREIIDSKNNTLCKSEYKYNNFNKVKAELKDTLDKGIKFSANTLCFRNSEMANLIFPIPKNVIEHDYYLAVCFSLFGDIRYIHETLIKYRIHTNNLSGNYSLETVKTYNDYKSVIKKLQMRRKKIVSSDSKIIEQHINEKFGKKIKFTIKSKENNFKSMISRKLPFIHYLYLKVYTQRKFNI